MTEERDISGFALPFASAAALAVFCEFPSQCNLPIILAFLTVTLAALTLLHPVHYRFSHRTILALIVTLASATGLICGLTSVLTQNHVQTGSDFPTRLAMQAGLWCKKEISLIEFSNPQTNAIISALLTGDRSTLSDATVQAFRNSGASHILALSGLHLGIIYGILLWCLKPLGKTRRAETVRSLVIISCCGFYTLATGAGPSITRALLFIITGEGARLHNRSMNLKNTLMSALLIQTALDPGQIASVGFQLSYLAMAGIAWIHPWLKGLWPEGRQFPIMRRIWNSLSISISCQITTAPLAYMYFHTFPVHFLLTNLIALPLTGIIIPAALLTSVLSIAGVCPDILLHMTEALVTIMTRALDIISSM